MHISMKVISGSYLRPRCYHSTTPRRFSLINYVVWWRTNLKVKTEKWGALRAGFIKRGLRGLRGLRGELVISKSSFCPFLPLSAPFCPFLPLLPLLPFSLYKHASQTPHFSPFTFHLKKLLLGISAEQLLI